MKNDAQDPVSVVFEEEMQRSAAYVNGAQIGECEYQVSDSTWVITHTGVRPEFGGRGIARKLVDKVVEAARERKVRILPVCSYAVKVLAGEEYADVRHR